MLTSDFETAHSLHCLEVGGGGEERRERGDREDRARERRRRERRGVINGIERGWIG